jgi:hypothetical protein
MSSEEIVVNKKERIHYVCSLGALCNSASWLKQQQLKLCSFPFDWIFSSPNIVVSCLQDDFDTFLNRSYHRSAGNGRSSHSVLHPRGHPTFNHHDITIDSTYEYFTRCVRRFRILLSKPLRKLFLLMQVNNGAYPNEHHICEWKRLNDALADRTTNFEICVVYHIVDLDVKQPVVTQEIYDNVRALVLRCNGRSNGISFWDQDINQFLTKTIRELYEFDILDNIKCDR